MRTSDVSAIPREPGVATVEKTLSILEIVAERGGATAKEVSLALGYPLPTVYRLMQALVSSDYLVHLKGQRRFELGYKLDRLGVSLHRQIGVPNPVRAEIGRLHDAAQTAGYFAVYRGADVVVAYVVDSPEHPRLTPLGFGFHEAAHATAFGKIMLAGMTPEQVNQYLEVHGMPRMTERTMTSRAQLDEHLAGVGHLGVAWEHEEFVPGMTCAAVGVRNGAGMVVGAVAISAPSEQISRVRERELERYLRDASNHVSRYYRSGQTRKPGAPAAA
ncbi:MULTISPECIES: IclR family transcriptional regulator [Subtercola]|uniref:IclR family transcriptional regulator n=1 Tax=Subtercola vilae TaxID=2056433 RepID=A0A4T2BYX4_9MICO|nr:MULTISPECIES: IclR family transcriptional regulator [Subtercola]MEA9985560.1 IclR family transcriptional regulator [Subtercola sp. RTI3]TIH36312.1 IclR family transcriptional regulator [Subtercola vilae]